MTAETWWRAVDKRYADYDPWAEWEQPSSSHLVIELRPYKVLRHTPKGVFLEDGQYIRGVARKQFAVPTRELALLDLIARKKTQILFCEHRLNRAKEHLEGAERKLRDERRETKGPLELDHEPL